MNPRERVLLALNHREPDRIPVDHAFIEGWGSKLHMPKEGGLYLECLTPPWSTEGTDR